MTKEKLLDLIKQYGSFWYVSGHYCQCTGGTHIFFYREASASDVNQFKDLINYSTENPDSIQISSDNLFLSGRWDTWLEANYPSGVDGEFSNYSKEDIAIIIASEQ